MIGSTLSHYKITGELGRGGMGIVYKGEDTKLNRTVAIKVLPVAALSNEDDRARFYREARAAASLSHPNIAIIHQIDEAVPSNAPHGTEPSPFIAMEFIEGDTLEDQIKMGPFGLEEAVRIAMAEVGAASDYTIDQFGTMYSKQFNADGVLSLGDNFVVLDPSSGAENQLTLTGKYFNHRVSPDGRQISFSADNDENGVGEYISVFDRQTGNTRQLTPNGQANFSAWSADGESLYLEFNSKLERWSNASLLRLEAIETEGLVGSFDVSPDENLIIYINHDNQGFGNLHMLDRESGEDRIIMTGSYRDPRFSPDGKFIAVSDGNPIRVVVYSVEDETTIVATNASELAYEALWGPDSALYYHADPNLLIRLPVSLDGSFRPTGRSSLINAFNSDFSMDFMSNGSVVIHERSASSRPFTPGSRSESFKIDVTTNWFEVAKRIAPASQ